MSSWSLISHSKYRRFTPVFFHQKMSKISLINSINKTSFSLHKIFGRVEMILNRRLYNFPPYRNNYLEELQAPLYTETSPSTCCRARYLSLRSFWENNSIKINEVHHISKSLQENLHKMLWDSKLTHSSMTRPSPIILGPASSGGFLRFSTAASASANWRFNFSMALMKQKNKNLITGMLYICILCMLILNTLQMQKQSHWNLKLMTIVLTGLERSGSRKTTRNICSTATCSFCSSNWRKRKGRREIQQQRLVHQEQ